MKIDNISFELESKIKAQVKVDGKNDIIDLGTLYLTCPSYKEKDKTLPLKQAFITAQTRLSFAMADLMDSDSVEKRREERESKEEDNKMDIQGIKMILFASGEQAININLFFDNFAKLLKAVCFKDEEMTQPINDSEIQKIEENDFENLVAKYIEVFFISSWMKTLS
jgi:hypothetical protein